MRGPKLVPFLRTLYQDNAQRLPEQRRSLRRDLWLYAKNLALRPQELWLLRRYGEGTRPPVFIVGVPRSGTTLLYQLMARHLDVVYIHNYAARYWLAPLVGLRRFERRNPKDPAEPAPLRSEFGGTEGPASPHEFTYFWQYWTEFGETDQLTESELDDVDWPAIRQELSGIAAWADQPLVLKCVTFLDYHVPRFAREFPSAKFVWIRRESRFVARSILESRRRRYGTETVWWSLRPRDVAAWTGRDPLEQVCHQIRHAEGALTRGFSALPPSRGLTLSYEELVADPPGQLERLAEFVPVALREVGALRGLRLASQNEPSDRPELLERAAALLAGPLPG